MMPGARIFIEVGAMLNCNNLDSKATERQAHHAGSVDQKGNQDSSNLGQFIGTVDQSRGTVRSCQYYFPKAREEALQAQRQFHEEN